MTVGSAFTTSRYQRGLVGEEPGLEAHAGSQGRKTSLFEQHWACAGRWRGDCT